MSSEKQIGNETVKTRTGRGWEQWFAILDRWGALERRHAETAKHLATKHGLSPWWSQAVTVRYELERGLRVKGQRGRLFELSVTRTVTASRSRAFRTFIDPAEQSIWFSTQVEAELRVGGRYRNADLDEGEFLRIERPKRIRFTWENPKHCPGTIVTVEFTTKDRGRTTVRLTHSKLRSERDREKMWNGWSWALDSFKSFVESGRPLSEAEWKKHRRPPRPES